MPGCLSKTIESVRKHKLEHWDRNRESNRAWLSLNMMTEANAGFRAFHYGTKQQREVNFIKLRQEFGDRNVSEFLLEYRLADFLRLRASAAPETSGAANRVGQRRVERGGLDLLFFFSY